ncbi:hypothetical protein KLP40_14830 [Hymenobacter sp. NST-14]|uniref:hypothetical protein n=1 Tax=Hymenobacter piscis TaxID=2839984 RepID=UPI001C02D87E|nr:hypothetical protein [Hymenobacter piscis]MBT9394444.1 hypothetical protein [Hymenobacter piscis]
MKFFTSHSDQELSEQALNAAVLVACTHCEVGTPHQVEEVVEALTQTTSLVSVRCEICDEQSLIVE